VVYIIPGLGSHRLAESAIALAELAYNRGFSAVTVSSVYNSEFMENASTANLPAYTPIDSHDLHVALTDIDHKLEELYPGRLKARALLGYSMGAFQSLFIAADAATNSEPLLKFDRYVAINTPVRLLYGISKLDEYCTSNIENTFLKVAALGSGSLRPEGALPFNAIESKFLIGFTFRLILRDIIYSSQLRHNQGVLTHPIHPLRRDALYKEIMQFSYKDYIEAFVIPYYQSRGIDLNDPHVLEKASDLRLYTSALKANPNVRLVGNRDDFLLADEDYEWLRTTFPTNRLTMFEKGGHLGNLAHPAVQKAIFNALEDLVPEKSSAK
jgi:pimeloyl-ACP methyl ester carboxylesterase